MYNGTAHHNPNSFIHNGADITILLRRFDKDDDSFKSVCWVDREGSLLAAGGSRGSVYIWHSEDSEKGPPPGGSDNNLKAAHQPRYPILSLNPPSPSPSNKIWGIDSSFDGSLLGGWVGVLCCLCGLIFILAHHSHPNQPCTYIYFHYF